MMDWRRSEEIGHDADDFEVEFFDLVAGEDGVGVAVHARPNLAKRKDFGGGRGLGSRGEERRPDCGCDRKRKSRQD